MDKKFIVAEIAHTWVNGESTNKSLISQQFEEVINTNLERGYELVNWKFNSLVVKKKFINETIVAVFKKI